VLSWLVACSSRERTPSSLVSAESPSCLSTSDAPKPARLNKVLDVPNLIDIQRRSFEWLVDAQTGGLRETTTHLADRGLHRHLKPNFGEFVFDQPSAIEEREGPHSRPPTVTVAFINHDRWRSASSRSLGDFRRTERGTFIINGTERVVVTQLCARRAPT
jgi:DNA-directed RNA polymerase subunit beta